MDQIKILALVKLASWSVHFDEVSLVQLGTAQENFHQLGCVNLEMIMNSMEYRITSLDDMLTADLVTSQIHNFLFE